MLIAIVSRNPIKSRIWRHLYKKKGHALERDEKIICAEYLGG